MANTARVTQSALEVLTTEPGQARVTQSIIEFIVGLGISCNNPPVGIVGLPYVHTFLAGAGQPPYTFTITAGSLPAGLVLAAGGGVSGTPTVPGVSTFTVTVTDAFLATASVVCSITVNPSTSGGGTSTIVGGGPYVIPKPCLCDVQELAVQAVERARDRKREWPYRWSFPAPAAIRFTAQSSIAVPTVAAGETQALLYTVEQGYRLALESVIVEYLANGRRGNANPGDFTWTVDLNTPEGTPSFQGQGIQGLTAIDVPLGRLDLPWPLECPELFEPNDAVRVKFINVNLFSGLPNQFKAVLMGWRWPVV